MAGLQDGSHNLSLDGSFLKDLPLPIKRYTYCGKRQFFDILESESARFQASTDSSEFLLFHASNKTIENIFDPENEDTSIAKFVTSFDTHEQLFLVTMPSTPHSAAAYEMDTAIRQALAPMGLSYALQGYAGATIRGVDGAKQADCGWGPKRRIPGQPSSPSSPAITLEVAYSETDSKLNSDLRFWLSPERGDVNLCFTLRIHRSYPEIRIEKWERQNDRIHRAQVTWITKRNDRVNVTHHPLTIPFESLFRRQSSRPGERDLQISQQQLEELAESIWQEQGW